MVSDGRYLVGTNPFATRWVRPDAVPYQFPPGLTAQQLVNRLAAQGWRGAIVGPHGSGKSTLLCTLIPSIEEAGRSVRRVVLRDRQRRLPGDFTFPKTNEAAGVVIVDGYEQLGWWSRWRLNRACHRAGWGLLVTSHAPCGLTELYRCQVDLSLAERLIDEVLPSHGGLIKPVDVRRAFESARGNLRDALMALYDLFERRRRTPSKGRSHIA